jgi:dTMP kinase
MIGRFSEFINEQHDAFFMERKEANIKAQVAEILKQKKPKNKRGLLIVFEGIDGAGKSTQVDQLIKWLEKDQGYAVTYSKWNSSKLMKPVIDKAKDKRELTPLLYSLLHASDMVYRYNHEICPALAANKIVICDRYIYTSIVRDKARGVDVEFLNKIYKDFREPDILFHCVVPIHVAFGRLVKEKGLSYYGSGMDLNLADNREENYVKYEHILDKYYKQVLPAMNGYVKLEMRKSIPEIFDDIKATVTKKFGIGRYDKEES